MWPVVYGLSDILGDTTLFSWNNEKTKKNEKKWNNFINGKVKMGKFITNKLKFTKPIAVIVSRDTSSSGEFIASLFIGRDNTKLFGKNTDKTGGFFSVNGGTDINKDINFILTSSLQTTVDGVFHSNEIIKVDQKTSRPITDATKWIKSFK